MWSLHEYPTSFLRRELMAYIRLAEACESWQITPEQVQALRFYSFVGSEDINMALRTGTYTGTREKLVARMAALESIKPVPAPAPMKLYRGVQLPSWADQPQAGQVWADPGYLSCSLRRSMANEVAVRINRNDPEMEGATQYLMEIQVRTGDPLIPLYWAKANLGSSSARACLSPLLVSESEIVLGAATNLEITEYAQRADGVVCLKASLAQFQGHIRKVA